MKKFIIPFLFVSVVIGFFLSSCGSEKIIIVSPTTVAVEETITVPTTIETTTTEKRITTTSALNLDEEFLAYIRSNTSLEYLLTDAQLIEFAQVVCNAFAAGMSSDQVVQIIYNAASGADLNQNQIMDLASLAGAGVATYCPEYAYKLNQ